LVFVVAFARLFAEHPAAVVLSTVLPDEAALTVALVVLEAAHVLLVVGPNEVAVTVHLVVDPVAVEILTVGPSVLATSLNFIHAEFTLIY